STTLAEMLPSARARSRTWSTTFGGSRAIPSHSGGMCLSRGARIRTLCTSFGGSLLSQEHTPVHRLSRGVAGRSGSGGDEGRFAFVGQEPVPAWNAAALRGVERLPLRPRRALAEPQTGLLGGAVGLAGITRLACGDAVGPARGTPLRPRHD